MQYYKCCDLIYKKEDGRFFYKRMYDNARLIDPEWNHSCHNHSHVIERSLSSKLVPLTEEEAFLLLFK